MQRLKSYSRSSLRFASVGGQRVLNNHQQLRSLIVKRLQRQDLADMFSIPEEDAGVQAFVWYTGLPGTAVAFPDLPVEARQQWEARLLERMAELSGLARQIRSEGPPERRSLEAEIIEAALRVPDDSCKFVVGDQLVVAAWGADLIRTERQAVDLIRRGPGVVEPPPPAAAASPPSSPAAPPPAAAPAAGISYRPAPAARTGRPMATAVPGWSLWLLWLLPLLLLVLLVWLLLRTSSLDGLAAWLDGLIPAAPSAGATREGPEEASLRREIAALKKQLESKRDVCLAPQQPPPAGRAEDPRGQSLAIPQDAQARKDLSSLAGCWNAPDVPVVFGRGTAGEVSETAEVVLCFESDGRTGHRTVRNARVFCEGPLSADFQSDSVQIVAPKMKCSNNADFSEATITCRPQGAATACSVVQPSFPSAVDIPFTRRSKP